MKIAFYLSHPAHFHLLKHTINSSRKEGNEVLVIFNEKDVLSDLISDSGFADISNKIRTISNVKSGWQLKWQFIQKNLGMFRRLLAFRPNLVIGTSVIIGMLGRILGYKSMITNEDDFDVVKKTADLGYPYANHILCPYPCRTGKYDDKCLKYHSYHELAYLHPNNFKPDIEVVNRYFTAAKPYFLLRFAQLSAHHDVGITGLNSELATELIEILEPLGQVYITSERELEPEFEKYRIAIHPKDMHHVMAFASFYIGDSQTMAAEAGMLGVPYIRFNGFVGSLSYLEEIEKEYQLGCGIHVDNPGDLSPALKRMLGDPNLKEVLAERRRIMLSEKIDLTEHLTWLIREYPNSVDQWHERVPAAAKSRIVNGKRPND